MRNEVHKPGKYLILLRLKNYPHHKWKKVELTLIEDATFDEIKVGMAKEFIIPYGINSYDFKITKEVE